MIYNKFKVLVLLFLALSLTNGNAAGYSNFIQYFATLTASEIAKIPKTVIEDSILDTVSDIFCQILKHCKFYF